MPGSRIEVEVAGSSDSLQDAVAKAAESLQDLGDVLARTSEDSQSLGSKIVESNDKLSASYAKTAETAKGAADDQTEAMSATADAAESMGGRIAAASGDIASAAGVSADAVDDATKSISASIREQTGQLSSLGAYFQEQAEQLDMLADREEATLSRVADAAKASADEQTEAAKEIVDAQEEAAVGVEGSASRQVSAQEEAAAAARASGDAALESSTKQKDAAAESAAAFGSSKSEISKAGRDILLVTGAVGAGSLDMASKFQASTLRLNTQAGATTAALGRLRQGLLDMAGQVGFSPDQLSDGLYHAVSSMNALIPKAQRVSGELAVLKVAAEGAQVGGSDLEDTTYALASAMNALHDPASDAKSVMGQLNAIVGSGDMTMQDLVSALSTGIIPNAAAAGVSLQSVGAALATMGDLGQQGASAATHLRMVLALLSSPSEAAAGVLEKIGLSSKQATADTAAMSKALEEAGLRTTSLSADLHKPDGIVVALTDLRDHLRESGLTATGTAAVMEKAFGGARTGASVIELEKNLDRVQAKYQQIGQSGNQFGSDWTKTSDSFRVDLDRMISSLEALLVKLGNQLMPVARDVMTALGDVAGWFDRNKTAVDALGIAVGTFATVAVGSYLIGKLRALLEMLKGFGSAIETMAAPMQKFMASMIDSLGGLDTYRTESLQAGQGQVIEAAGTTSEDESAGIGQSRAVEQLLEASQQLSTGADRLQAGGLKLGDAAELNIDAAKEQMTAAQRMLAAADRLIEGAERSTVTSEEDGFDGTMGARGPGGGTMANPVIVAQEAGEYAGLGSEGAAGTVETEEHAAAAEVGETERSVGAGETVPTVATKAAGELESGASEETLATTGLLASLKSGLPGVLEGAMKGGMIAIGGDIASKLAGSMIGGSAGRDVEKIGTDASIGAGVGSVVPGVGTVAGGAAGAVIGAITTFFGQGGDSAASKFGTAAADRFSRSLGSTGLGDIDGQNGAKLLADATKNLAASLTDARKLQDAGTPHTDDFGAGTSAPNDTDLKQAQDEYNKAGRQAAEAWDLGVSEAKVRAPQELVANALASLNTLPDQARGSAAQAMIEYAGGLQEQGELPAKTVSDLISSILSQFPGMDLAFANAGQNSDQALEAGLRLTQSQAALKAAITTFSTDFDDAQISAKLTGQNIDQNLDLAMTALQEGVADHTGAMKAQFVQELGTMETSAKQNFSNMYNASEQSFNDMQTSGQDAMSKLESEIVSASASGGQTASLNYATLAQGIQAAMQAGVISASTGTKDINTALQNAIKSFGGKQIPTPAGVTYTPTYVGGTGRQFVNVATLGAGAAQGTMVQYGEAGGRGKDTIATNIGGRPIAVGSGEIGAVFTAQQQRVVNGALGAQGINGLPGLFSSVTAKHYMAAQGGIVAGLPRFADGGVVESYGQLEGLWEKAGGPGSLADVAAAIAEAESGGRSDAENPSGASGLWQILGLPFPGNVFDPLTNARMAVAKWRTAPGGGDNFTPWTTYTSGAYETYLKGSVPANLTGGGGGAGVSVPTIQTPQVQGSGEVASMVQSGLTKVTEQANQYLQQQAAAASAVTGIGGGGGGGTTMSVAGAKNVPAQVQKALTVAQEEVGKPYIWAGYGVDAPGLDCSGMVSTVLTAAGFADGHMTAAELADWGVPGDGKWITVGVRFDGGGVNHTMMDIGGDFFESGGGGPYGAANVHRDPGWDGTFPVHRHPPGFAAGGIVGDFGEVKAADLLRRTPGLAQNVAFKQYEKMDLQGFDEGGIADDKSGSGPSNSSSSNSSSTAANTSPTGSTTNQPPLQLTSTVASNLVAAAKKAAKKTLPLPKIPAYADFNFTGLTALDTQISNLTNRASYISSLNSSGPAYEPLVTQADGSQVVNLGSPSTNGSQPTGMVDPSTGEVTYGIYDRVRQIVGQGVAIALPSGPPASIWTLPQLQGTSVSAGGDSDITSELGINEAVYGAYLDERVAAKQTIGQVLSYATEMLADWTIDTGGPTGSTAQTTNRVGWLEAALNQSLPMANIGETFDGLGKNGDASWDDIILDRATDYRNLTAVIERITYLKEQLPQLQSDREASIEKKFDAIKSNIESADDKTTFTRSSILDNMVSALEADENESEAAVPNSAPSSWKGDAKTWDQEAALEKTTITNEYAARIQALKDAASKAGLNAELKKSKAELELSDQETNDKTALSDYFDKLTTNYTNDISADTSTQTSDRSWLSTLESHISAQGTSAKDAYNNAYTSDGPLKTLDQYLDPNGDLQVDMDTMANITIAGLGQQVADALNTIVPANEASITDEEDELTSLLQQQNATLAEALNLSENQTGVLRGMLPTLPSYDTGGPIMSDQIAKVHQGEWVVPKGGALVSTAPAAPNVEVHHQTTVSGSIAPLLSLIDSRVTHPTNIRAIQKTIGRSTQKLSGAPGRR